MFTFSSRNFPISHLILARFWNFFRPYSSFYFKLALCPLYSRVWHATVIECFCTSVSLMFRMIIFETCLCIADLDLRAAMPSKKESKNQHGCKYLNCYYVNWPFSEDFKYCQIMTIVISIIKRKRNNCIACWRDTVSCYIKNHLINDIRVVLQSGYIS